MSEKKCFLSFGVSVHGSPNFWAWITKILLAVPLVALGSQVCLAEGLQIFGVTSEDSLEEAQAKLVAKGYECFPGEIGSKQTVEFLEKVGAFACVLRQPDFEAKLDELISSQKDDPNSSLSIFGSNIAGPAIKRKAILYLTNHARRLTFLA